MKGGKNIEKLSHCVARCCMIEPVEPQEEKDMRLVDKLSSQTAQFHIPVAGRMADLVCLL
jgi:hypothetical protein